MKLYVRLIDFIFTICVCHACLASEEFNVTFYNVGQGDCTIIDSVEKGVLIVDAGSSDTVGVPSLPEQGKYEALAERIFELIREKIIDRTLYFIVTHSDQDHLNLIHHIISKTLSESIRTRICVLFGGSETNYSKSDGEKLIKLLEVNHVSFCFGANSFNMEDLYFIPSRSMLQGAWSPNIRYISVNRERAIGRNTDPNDTSIVIKLNLGNKNIILTGDKTKGELAAIVGRFKQSGRQGELKTDILLATHHGSHLDFCEEWLEATNPNRVIFSSGRKYGHPTRSTVSQYYNALPVDGTNQWHFIKFLGKPYPMDIDTATIPSPLAIDFIGDELKIIYEEHPDSSIKAQGYVNAVTQKYIFMTCTQGNITFNISRNRIISDTEIPNFSDTDFSRVFSLIFSHSRHTFPIKGIYLNQMSVVANDLFLSDSSIFIPHLSPLKEGELKEISFVNCNLETDEKITRLTNLIDYFDTLSKLDLSENRFESRHHELVKGAWNNRGLVMPLP